MDRRALFFLVAAVAAGMLALVIEDDLVYVPRLLAIVYVALAVVSWLDWRTNNRVR
jgi:flagellar biosynthesis protein FliQ